MAFTVQDWYQSVQSEGVTLLAGEGGLAHPVWRAHIVEKPELANFLEGDEIVFITGVALAAPAELLEVVRRCQQAGAAAIAVNVGFYLPTIPPAVTGFCATQRLPLFAVPWDVHLERLMQKIYRLSADSAAPDEFTALLQAAIQCPQQTADYLPGLARYGFPAERPYCVALVQPVTADGAADKSRLLSRLAEALNRPLEASALPKRAVVWEDKVLVLFGSASPPAAEAVLDELCRAAGDSLGLKALPEFTLGRVTQSARCIYKSYALAQKIEALHRSGQLPPSVRSYQKLGVYKIIIGLENQDVLKEIRREYWEPLRDYDRACGTDFTEFVRTYLQCEGQVKDIAQQLFVHRNTVHYKIHKVEEILDCDLSRTDVRMYLLLAQTSEGLEPIPPKK